MGYWGTEIFGNPAEAERNRLRSELDQLRRDRDRAILSLEDELQAAEDHLVRLRADVEPVLRAAERVERVYLDRPGWAGSRLVNALTNLADKLATFRQQHPKED